LLDYGQGEWILKVSRLDRILRLFTDIKVGESPMALMMFANVFLILCAYYLIKPLREGWIAVSDISGLSKMEVKAYSSFAQGVLLIPIVVGYARLSARWSRAVLVTRSTLFCMSNMVLFWVLQPNFFFDSLPVMGIVFYLWVGIFGVFVVAQFWTFAADLYTSEQGDRLLPLIAIGATSGAVVGSWLTEQLAALEGAGSEWLLIAALVPLTVSILLTRAVDARTRGGTSGNSSPKPAAGGNSGGALRLVLSNKFLLITAGVTLLLSWVNTNGENILFRVVQEMLEGEAVENAISDPGALAQFTLNETASFYGSFYFWVNVLALLLQAFAASRILKYGGFRALLLMMPVLSLLSYSAMALIPILAVIKVMKIVENATDYSINNTARHVLWLPTSAEMKYKGKPAIDTFFVRAGDGLAALTVLVGVQIVTLSTQGFLVFTVLLVLIWLALAVALVREYRKMSEAKAVAARVE
jgi:AAA family ATP:ADP antiporter